MNRKLAVGLLWGALAVIGGLSLGFFCYLGLLVLFDADFKLMTQPAFISALGGGAVGAIFTIVANQLTSRESLRARQRAIIGSLHRELEQIQRLCAYNKGLQSDVGIAPFVRFPILVLTNVAFGERQDFPMLEPLQEDLQSVALGASQVNELIGLRDSMWAMEKNQGQDYRHLVRNEICEICAGTKTHTGSERNLPDSVERTLNSVRAITKRENGLER